MQKVIQEDISEIISEFKEDLKSISGKTILVTGGNGLIPSYLVDTIAEFNKRVQNPAKLIIMNKNPITFSSRLAHLLDDPNVTFLTQDVGKHFDVIGDPDIIIHAASRANPTAFLEDPIDTIDANVNATRIFLNYARDRKIDNFIFFSSAEIYGNPLREFLPTPEEYAGNATPLDKYSCYIESKRFCETLCHNFFTRYNVPISILRIGMTYGPGIRNDGKAVSDFFERAFAQGLITLRDAGEARRSFCYVSDVAKAIFKIMFHGEKGQAYNVGHDLPQENISIRQLAELIARTVSSDITVAPNLDAPKRQVSGEENRWLNISKLRDLGFEPKVGIAEGLARTKKYYDEKRFQR